MLRDKCEIIATKVTSMRIEDVPVFAAYHSFLSCCFLKRGAFHFSPFTRFYKLPVYCMKERDNSRRKQKPATTLLIFPFKILLVKFFTRG